MKMATAIHEKRDATTASMQAMYDPATLADILPAPIVYRGGHISALQKPLHPLETPFIENAVERRVREFTAGRTCARSALASLGHMNVPILVGSRREPLWPAGIVGSISHAAGYCMAAVCTRTHFAGLGVDLEHATPLADSLVALVCTPRERAWAERQPGNMTGLLGKFMFSAKESVFKGLFPLFGEELEFDEVELDLDLHQGRFTAHVSRFSLNADADVEVHGRLTCSSQLVMTAAVMQDADMRRLSLAPSREFADRCAGRYLCGSH